MVAMVETTTIEVSRENWRWLNSRKNPGESFNDVIDRLRQGEGERESGGDDSSDGQAVECHHCGYSWTYGGDMTRATCPDCKGTTSVS